MRVITDEDGDNDDDVNITAVTVHHYTVARMNTSHCTSQSFR